MNEQIYEYADRVIATLSRNVWRVFLRYQKKIVSALLHSDGSNQFRAISTALYNELDELNIIALKKIASRAYGTANGNKKIDWEEWLLILLSEPDTVTQYIYTREIIRKRDRFTESILSTRIDTSVKDRISLGDISQLIRRAYSLWYRQCKQYSISVTDAALLQAYNDVSVKKVKWHTAKDDGVCRQCCERDGMIYNIDEIPSKPHYFCRCWISPEN